MKVKSSVVRLKIRVRLPDGSYPFVEPVFASNGKLKPLYAVVDGQQERHPEGVYHLRYLSRGRRVWESVGQDAQLALVAKLKRERIADAKAAGIDVVEEGSREARTPLKPAIQTYLEEVKTLKGHKTYLGYALALKELQEECAKPSLEEVNRKDLVRFMDHLKAKGHSPRTVANRVRAAAQEEYELFQFFSVYGMPGEGSPIRNVARRRSESEDRHGDREAGLGVHSER